VGRQPDAPLDAVGFTVHPSFRGATGVDARLRAADRWMRVADSAAGRAKPHWVFAVGGYPTAHGDLSQERAVRHTLAWATARASVRGMIVTEPGDYYTSTGLRASTGRLRRVVASLARASRGLQEAVVQ
jgi:hypothetical protein